MNQIEKIKKEVEAQAKGEAEETSSVFHSLLRSDMPPAELSDIRMSADAMALLAAGTATTSSVLTLIAYYIISDRRIQDRLRNELKTAMSGIPTGEKLRLTQLEKVPYLNACIREGLR
jgi:cytochrome P450